MQNLLIGFILGMLGPLKTGVNLRLGKVVNSLALTAFSTFFGSVFLLLPVNYLVEGRFFRNILKGTPLPWWGYLAGILAALAVMMNSFLFRRLGSMLTISLAGFAQLATGLLIDSLGLFAAKVVVLSPLKIFGVLIASMGIYMVISKSDLDFKRAKYILLALVEGVILGLSAAINSYVGMQVDSVGTASLLSLIVASAFLLAIIILKADWRKLAKLNGAKLPWWSFSGGVCEAANTYLRVKIVPLIGNSRLALWTLIGKVMLGLVISKKLTNNWIYTNKNELLGLFLLLLGTILVEIAVNF